MNLVDINNHPFHEIRYRTSGRNGVRNNVLPFYRAKAYGLPIEITSFVVVSDLQGREVDKNNNRLVGEAVAEELSVLQELGEISNIDFVLLAGDLYDYPDLRKLGGTGDVTSVWNEFASRFKEVVGVMGNHDQIRESDLADNVTLLDGDAINISGIRIGGVSGIVGDEGRNQRKLEKTFRNYLDKACAGNADIVVLHQGPDDPERGQKGAPMIREFFAKRNAGIVFFGHTYWQQPLMRLGKNDVLNVDSRLYLVEAVK